MQAHIDGNAFGSITVGGEKLNHNIVVRPGGKVKKRKKKLSWQHYDTSHKVSKDEAK